MNKLLEVYLSLRDKSLDPISDEELSVLKDGLRLRARSLAIALRSLANDLDTRI